MVSTNKLTHRLKGNYCLLTMSIILIMYMFSSCIFQSKANSTKTSAVLISSMQAQQSAIPGFIQQPSSIPGNYVIENQPFPPINDIINKTADSLPVYGIYSWAIDFYEYYDRIMEVGWSSVRIGGWLDDTRMARLMQSNMEVMFTYTTSDVTTDHSLVRESFTTDQSYVDAYIASIQNAMSHYGPGGSYFTSHPTPYNPIKYWEIFNEPNFQYMWPSGTNTQKQQLYAKLLNQTYTAIKNPGITIVGFGAGGASCADSGFINGVLDYWNANTLGYNHFDIASTHPYNLMPDASERVSWGTVSTAISMSNDYQAFSGHGITSSKWWWTEIGYMVNQGAGGSYPNGTLTQRLQAAYVCRTYLIGLRCGVDRVHIMYIKDTDNCNAGLFKSPTEWRESARAVKNMIHLMPHPKITSAISDGTNGYYAYELNPEADSSSSNPVIMAWKVNGTSNAEINCGSGQYRIYDMLGNSIDRQIGDEGIISVPIGPCPIYIVKL